MADLGGVDRDSDQDPTLKKNLDPNPVLPSKNTRIRNPAVSPNAAVLQIQICIHLCSASRS